MKEEKNRRTYNMNGWERNTAPATRARWAGHSKIPFRTIRIREDVLELLRGCQGKTWGEKIMNLVECKKGVS